MTADGRRRWTLDGERRLTGLSMVGVSMVLAHIKARSKLLTATDRSVPKPRPEAYNRCTMRRCQGVHHHCPRTTPVTSPVDCRPLTTALAAASNLASTLGL